MSLRKPKRGDVIRYAYLWAAERNQGRTRASKDRPALVIAIAIASVDGQDRIMVLAITHSPPGDPADAIELPEQMKRKLGLDEMRSWIVTTEANAFKWPDADIQPVSGKKPSTIVYGNVPKDFRLRVVAAFLKNREKRRATITIRE